MAEAVLQASFISFSHLKRFLETVVILSAAVPTVVPAHSRLPQKGSGGQAVDFCPFPMLTSKSATGLNSFFCPNFSSAWPFWIS